MAYTRLITKHRQEVNKAFNKQVINITRAITSIVIIRVIASITIVVRVIKDTKAIIVIIIIAITRVMVC